MTSRGGGGGLLMSCPRSLVKLHYAIGGEGVGRTGEEEGVMWGWVERVGMLRAPCCQ